MSGEGFQNNFAPPMWWAAFLSIALVETLLVVKFFTEKTSGELLIAIVIIAVLLIISPRIADLVAITLSKDEMSLKLKEVERDLTQAQTKIAQTKEELEKTKQRIDQLFLLSMSEPMYQNLKKIATGKFGSYKKSKALERELYHLRDVGYVDIVAIQAIPPEGEELSKHVKVTKTGEDFVKLRELIEFERIH
jgi:MFS superfamily sulfate permease-like transporter